MTKPTALKILQGNPGKRKLPEGEPMPDALPADAPVPDEIKGNPEAAKAWRDALTRLVPQGVLTEMDVPALIMYCEAAADEVNAREQMGAEGCVQVSASGHAQVSAWFTVARDARNMRLKLLQLFGMSPVDRRKVVGSLEKPKDENPFK